MRVARKPEGADQGEDSGLSGIREAKGKLDTMVTVSSLACTRFALWTAPAKSGRHSTSGKVPQAGMRSQANAVTPPANKPPLTSMRNNPDAHIDTGPVSS
jgi:hypothetical protein